jgi:TPR repeat protein
MKSILRSMILVIFWAATFIANAQTDFDKGVAAAQVGDYESAYDYWLPLASAGDALAQTNIGILYENGWGLTKDYKQAIDWYLKAAEQGEKNGQHNLATMYHGGHGVEQDVEKAAYWFQKAAEQGHSDASLMLGILYQEVGQFELAAFWYQNATKLGNEDAPKNFEFLCQMQDLGKEYGCQ